MRQRGNQESVLSTGVHRKLRFALAVLLAGTGLYGQTPTATLSGIVRDPAASVVVAAKVTVRNTATGIPRTTDTDGEGRYRLTNLEPGPYELRVEAPGFRTVVRGGIVLTVGGSSEADVSLELGVVTDVVTVTQEVPLIDTSKAEVSRVVTGSSIESLPIIGRNFVDFAKLSSGVAPGRENTGGGAFKEPDAGVGVSAAPRLSFGGQSELSTLILVDGADNVQTFTGLPRATPSQEAAAEFRILNNTFESAYGRARAGS
jgi:hypothetical protein